MYTLEKMEGGYSVTTGQKLSDGYKVFKNGHLVFLLLTERCGGYSEYWTHNGQWKTGHYFSDRPSLKAWKEYYGITG